MALKVRTVEVAGIFTALHAMRNPLNSWDKSDSHQGHIGDADKDLVKRLIKSGPEHCKFLRAIYVSCEVWGPMYWWAEADTYKVGTVRNSCSKMHKLMAKPFELDDFEHDGMDAACTEHLKSIIDLLNIERGYYLNSKDVTYWRNTLLLLPESYIQRSTWTMSYAVLRNIYHQRKNHKLPEWHTFCDWIETLPESWMITDKEENQEVDE